jgi:hypothetical protein
LGTVRIDPAPALVASISCDRSAVCFSLAFTFAYYSHCPSPPHVRFYAQRHHTDWTISTHRSGGLRLDVESRSQRVFAPVAPRLALPPPFTPSHHGESSGGVPISMSASRLASTTICGRSSGAACCLLPVPYSVLPLPPCAPTECRIMPFRLPSSHSASLYHFSIHDAISLSLIAQPRLQAGFTAGSILSRPAAGLQSPCSQRQGRQTHPTHRLPALLCTSTLPNGSWLAAAPATAIAVTRYLPCPLENLHTPHLRPSIAAQRCSAADCSARFVACVINSTRPLPP